MFYNAINGNIKIGNTDMDYISFGKGDIDLGCDATGLFIAPVYATNEELTSKPISFN